MSEHTEQVRSLWIPLRQVNMLLPHAVVAEIGNYRVPDSRDDTPEWLLGDINWRGTTIPVVSLESLCGESAPANLVYSRLLIINSERPGCSVPLSSSSPDSHALPDVNSRKASSRDRRSTSG